VTHRSSAVAVRRREVLAGAAALVLARPAAAAAAGRSDEAVLVRLVAREEAAVEAYRDEVVPGLRADEEKHAAALRTHLDALGRRPAPKGLDEPARKLAEASGEARVEAAIALEASLVEAYSEALLDLEAPGVLQTAATILASHAQHLALLREQSGLDPLA
jgi:Ferritin-like domain